MKKTVGVFCGARFPNLENGQLNQFKFDVQKFCGQLAPRYNLVYGGGRLGLMGLVADEFLKNQSHVTGVIPFYLNTIEIKHDEVSETHQVEELHERKALMEKTADIFLVLPGGIGTLDELCEVLTLQSLDRHKKMIYIWNWNRVFDGFFQFVMNGIEQKLIASDLLTNCVISEDLDKILENLLGSGSKLG